MARIGPGEFHKPGHRTSTATAAARAVFLALIAEMAPDVLRTLHRDVMPAFRSAHALGPLQPYDLADYKDLKARRKRARDAIRRGGPTPARLNLRCRLHYLMRLRRALAKWGKHWDLVDAWILEVARSNLEEWAASPYPGEEPPPWPWTPEAPPMWRWVAVAPALGNVPGPIIQPPPWRPEVITWGRYLESLHRHYKPAVEEAYRAGGWTERPQKRTDPPDLHLRWLVRFHILGVGYDKIAKLPGAPSPRKVRQAVVSTADLLGLTRRPRRTKPRTN